LHVSFAYVTAPDRRQAHRVMARGSATLVHEVRVVPIDQPEVVPTAVVVGRLPPSEQRILRLFNVDHCLRVRPTAPKKLRG
jgi:hypothetical protein